MLPDWLIDKAGSVFPDRAESKIFLVSYNFELESYIYSWRWVADGKPLVIDRHVPILNMRYCGTHPDTALDHVFKTVAEEIENGIV